MSHLNLECCLRRHHWLHYAFLLVSTWEHAERTLQKVKVCTAWLSASATTRVSSEDAVSTSHSPAHPWLEAATSLAATYLASFNGELLCAGVQRCKVHARRKWRYHHNSRHSQCQTRWLDYTNACRGTYKGWTSSYPHNRSAGICRIPLTER